MAEIAWAVGRFYLVVSALFIITVASWEGGNWRELGGAIWLWITTVTVFATLCVGVYLYFRFWAPPLPEEHEGEEVPLERIE